MTEISAHLSGLIWFVVWGVFVVALMAAALVDLRFKIIPDKITLFLMMLGMVLALYSGGIDAGFRSVIGLIVGGGVMYFLATMGPIGGGDVKLAAAIGSFMGPQSVLGILVLSFVLASLVALMGIVLKKMTLNSEIPFGPFMVVATFVVMIWGLQLWKFCQILMGL